MFPSTTVKQIVGVACIEINARLLWFFSRVPLNHYWSKWNQSYLLRKPCAKHDGNIAFIFVLNVFIWGRFQSPHLSTYICCKVFSVEQNLCGHLSRMLNVNHLLTQPIALCRILFYPYINLSTSVKHKNFFFFLFFKIISGVYSHVFVFF